MAEPGRVICEGCGKDFHPGGIYSHRFACKKWRRKMRDEQRTDRVVVAP